MKKIILDGYNVIHKLPMLTVKLDQGLEASRLALAQLLSTWCRRYSNADICIVFDGRDRESPQTSPNTIAGIKCIFTRTGEDADDRIIKLVRNSGTPRDVTVISEDNNVINSCRAHGADVKPASFLIPSNKKNRTDPKGSNKTASSSSQNRITAYYKACLRDRGCI